MVGLVCDICGGKLVMQANGVAACDSCGMEYSKECLREKVQEIKGAVRVEGAVETTKGDAEKKRLFKNAETQILLGDETAAWNIFSLITKDYPDDYRGWMGYFRLMGHFRSDRADFTTDYQENYVKKALAVCDEHSRREIEKIYYDYYHGLCQDIDAGKIPIWSNRFKSIKEQPYALDNSQFMQCVEKHEAIFKKNAQTIKEATREWEDIRLSDVIPRGDSSFISCDDEAHITKVKHLKYFSEYDMLASAEKYDSRIYVVFKIPMTVEKIISEICTSGPKQQRDELERKEQKRKREQSAQWRRQGLCEYCGGGFGIFNSYKCKSCGKSR